MKAKLKILFKLLFKKHFVVLDIDTYNLVSLYLSKDFGVNIITFGISQEHAGKLIQGLANTRDEIDILLDVAKYEGEIESDRLGLN